CEIVKADPDALPDEARRRWRITEAERLSAALVTEEQSAWSGVGGSNTRSWRQFAGFEPGNRLTRDQSMPGIHSVTTAILLAPEEQSHSAVAECGLASERALPESD